MKQASLKIKSYVGNVSIVNNGNIEHKILNAMLVSLGALAVLYVFIMGSVVWNVVERKSLESYALTLSNEVSDLEISYLSVVNTVDAELGLSMGFKEKEAIFSTRKSLGQFSSSSSNSSSSLSAKRNEI